MRDIDVKLAAQSPGELQRFAQGAKVDFDVTNACAEMEVDAAGSELRKAADPPEGFKGIAGAQAEPKLP